MSLDEMNAFIEFEGTIASLSYHNNNGDGRQHRPKSVLLMMLRTSTDVHSKLTISQNVQIFICGIFTHELQ
jgi:hypothetical protein